MKKYLDTIINRTCESMSELDDDSIRLIVTSPPYFNLKEYSTWESYEDYLLFICQVVDECMRVLEPGGWLCWNVQDCIPIGRDNKADERTGCYPLTSDSIGILMDRGFFYEKDIIWYKGPGTATQRLFGCLARGTRVRMSNGQWLPIENVNIGDSVLSYDEKLGKITTGNVIKKHNNGKKDIVAIYTRNRTIKCTKNHNFLCLTRSSEKDFDVVHNYRFFKIQWKDSTELISTGKRVNRDLLLFPVDDRSSNKPLPYPPRLLGLFIADGWCNHSKNKEVLKTVDFEIWDEDNAKLYTNIIKNEMNYNPWFAGSSSVGTLHLCSIKFARWLRDNDFDNYACEKHVPDCIFQASRKDRIEFILGYLDGDGSVCKSSGSLSFSSCSKKLTTDIKCLLEGLGVICSNIIYGKPRKYKIGDKSGYSKGRYIVKSSIMAYSHIRKLLLSSSKVVKSKKSLRSKIILNIKGQKFIPQRILKIENFGIDDVYDLSIDKTYNYTADGVVVHNSYPYPGIILISSLTEHIITVRKPDGGNKIKVDKEIKEKSIMTKEEWASWGLDLWHIGPESAKSIGHPAPYPIEIPYRLIRMYSFVGDIVLDPFMGSGTTALAAKRCNRHFVGYELHEEYINLCENRLQQDVDILGDLN